MKNSLKNIVLQSLGYDAAKASEEDISMGTFMEVFMEVLFLYKAGAK
jgi:hypothetical protein